MITGIVSGFGSSAYAAHRVVKNQLTTLRENFTKQPELQRDIAYFKEKIGSVKSPAELVDDHRLIQFVTTAFNLEEQSFAKAFIRTVIEEGTDDKQDLARRMVDPRYRDMAETFAYDTKGMANVSDPKWVNGMVERYITQRFENEVGAANPAVATALYFDRKISDVDNWFGILGDKNLFEVVRTIGNLPASFSRVDVDKQKDKLESMFDLADFKDPAKRAKMIDRYLAVSDATSGVNASTSAAALGLQAMQSGGALTGMGPIITFDPTLFIGMK